MTTATAAKPANKIEDMEKRAAAIASYPLYARKSEGCREAWLCESAKAYDRPGKDPAIGVRFRNMHTAVLVNVRADTAEFLDFQRLVPEDIK